MNESFKKENNLKGEQELGNFEVKKNGGILLRKIPFCKILENEKEYKESKERGEAIRDLLKTWDTYLEVNVSNNVKLALAIPKNFEEFVEGLFGVKKTDFIKNFLENILLEFELLNGSFETAKEKFIEDRLDFKDTDDMDLNDELKSVLETKIKNIDESFNTLEDLISYTKTKITELL